VTNPPLAAEDWLCDRFGVQTQQDRPLAAIMLKADGGEPGSHYWLCADPIQLRVDRNRLLIAGRTADFSAGETRDLIAALNRHFSADGINFFAPTPARWYVRAKSTPRLVTTPLARALNRSVEHHLPRGGDALVWHRVMNEAQMIMHTHPVNTAREERGAAVANSIWLWGGGTLPATSRPPFSATWSGDHLPQSLAAGAGIARFELPATGAAWLSAASNDPHLLVIDAPANALRANGAAAWREQLTLLDGQWLRPLLTALRTKQIAALTLVACNNETLLETHISRPDLWRFWRRIDPLATYAGNA
jgi:hypothetical protein